MLLWLRLENIHPGQNKWRCKYIWLQAMELETTAIMTQRFDSSGQTQLFKNNILSCENGKMLKVRQSKPTQPQSFKATTQRFKAWASCREPGSSVHWQSLFFFSSCFWTCTSYRILFDQKPVFGHRLVEQALCLSFQYPEQVLLG